jgi:aryl-alcohol dehydrogenase-like predicted oxidoreductase
MESLARLRKPAIYGLLSHNADDVLKPGGERLIDRMRELRARGLVERIGVSVYSAQQLDRVLERFSIDLVQLPLNVFDQRLIRSGHLRRLREAGVEVHTRSAFLQGLLLMSPQSVPDHLADARDRVERFQRAAAGRGISPMAAALGFVLGVEEVNQVICGVNDRAQLDEICHVAAPAARLGDYSDFAIDDERIVNPAKWGRA